VGHALARSAGDGDLALRQAIGGLADHDVTVGKLGIVVWAALVVAWLAGRLLSNRDRRSLGRFAVAGVCTGAMIVLVGVLLQSTGGDIQGRYVLPGLVAAVVLVALAEPSTRRLPAFFATTIALGTAAVQVLAWWEASRRAAHGSGVLWFLDAAQWSPPGGWLLWTAVVIVGAASWAASGIALSRRQDPAGAG
jgi:hypothetical protein